jgi:hypothetical protein
LLVFLTLLIGTASVAQLHSQVLALNFAAAISNTPPAAVRQDKSLLVVPASGLEPNSWSNKFTDANTVSDANRGSLAKSPQAGSDENHQISALAIHALCADVLTTYVNDNGLVDYKTLKRKRLALLSVLNEFADLDPNSYAAWSKADKLAFWINAHNMCILKAVIDNYPIQPSRFKVIFYPPNSVMQLYNFWEKVDYTIMGEKYSLEELENKIIRPQFNEPRVCFALSYASTGCAPLRREPYYGHHLGQQLDDQARIFLESDKGIQIHREQRIVDLSALFQWYANEFKTKYPPAGPLSDRDPTEAAILTYISGQVPKKDADWLARKIFTVRYMRYDWALNEQP